MVRSYRLLSVLFLLLPCATACGEGGGGVSYYRDIKPLVEQRCVRCHEQGGIAPFALVSYEDVATRAGIVKNAVVERIMPPWLGGKGCADYKDDPSLSDEQIAAITRWVDSGAPKGDPADYQPLPALPAGGLRRTDVTLQMPAPYQPMVSPDDYRCFLLDWPATTVKYMTGFEARPGRPAVVHHVVAFLIPGTDRAQYQAYDDAEPGPGYTCFGGPNAASSTSSGYNLRIIGAWGPGMPARELPAGTGMQIQPGSAVVMQVHYNTLHGVDSDQTSMAFQLEDSVQNDAYTMPFTNPQWVLDPSTMLIPAGQPDVMHEFEGDTAKLAGPLTKGGIDGQMPFTLRSVSYHMHLRGTHGRMELVHADGSRECLIDIPRWDFHWQPSYGFATPKVVEPGDRLRIECHWDNSAANQPIVAGTPLEPRDLTFGENTTDEMCVGGFLLTQ